MPASVYSEHHITEWSLMCVRAAVLRHNADRTRRFVLRNPIKQPVTNLMSIDANTIYTVRHSI